MEFIIVLHYKSCANDLQLLWVKRYWVAVHGIKSSWRNINFTSNQPMIYDNLSDDSKLHNFLSLFSSLHSHLISSHLIAIVVDDSRLATSTSSCCWETSNGQRNCDLFVLFFSVTLLVSFQSVIAIANYDLNVLWHVYELLMS